MEYIKLSKEELTVPISYGFGFGCQRKLYPINPKTLEIANSQIVANYSMHEQAYKHGRKVEELVVSVLSSLDGIKAWRTDDNSQADCQFKWDVIIEVKGLLFALQVKSSKEGMQDFEVDKEDTPVLPVGIWASLDCDQNEMRRKFASWFNLEIKSEEIKEKQNVSFPNDQMQSTQEREKLKAKRNELAQRRRMSRRNHSGKKEPDDWQPE